MLPIYAYFYSIYPLTFILDNCFSCNHLDTSFYCYICSDNTILTQTINSSIQKIILNSNLNLSTHQLHNLIHTISSHPSFTFPPLSLYPYSLNSTLKGLIPISLIQALDPFDISYSNASQLIIQILLKISDQLYHNIWIPYCINFFH